MTSFFSRSSINLPTNKILVIKLCCLGDLIFLTPSFRALRQKYPSARITLLASPWIADIAHRIRFIDEVIVSDLPLDRRPNLRSIFNLIKLVRHLNEQRFDMVISGHRNKLFQAIGLLCRIPVRIGFGRRGSFLLTNRTPFLANEHEVKRYLDLLSSAGIRSSLHDTEITPPPEDMKQADSFLVDWGLKECGAPVGIFPGGGENPGTKMPIKRWGAEKYAELCREIARTGDRKIVLLGGVGDRGLNDEIIALSRLSGDRVSNRAGDTTIALLPALLSRFRIVIGGDTGPMHIAAAVGTPTLFLFGPSDPRLVAPSASNSRHLWNRVACAPCYTPETVRLRKYFRGNEFICWKNTHECLAQLSVDRVFERYNDLMRLHYPATQAPGGN